MAEEKTYTLEELKKELNNKQLKFCHEYIIDWNASRAAREAGYSEKTACEIGNENLRKPNIKAYIDLIKTDYEAEAGISKLKAILEWKKIAFSNITDLFEIEGDKITIKNNKKLSELPKEVTDLISEVQQTKDGIKLKLYCKDNALSQLAKLAGWNESEKIDHTITKIDGITFDDK